MRRYGRLASLALPLAAVLTMVVGASSAHAAIFDLGTTGTSVGNFNPAAINSSGNVAGTKIVAGTGGCGASIGHATLWTRSSETFNVFAGFGGAAETDRSSAAYDINDSNRIVGAADTADNCNGRHAFRSENGAAVVDLQAAGQPLDYSAALGVNAAGDVVGFSVVHRVASICDVLDDGDFADIADDDCPQPAYWAGGAAPGVLASMDSVDAEWMLRGISDTGRMVGYRFTNTGAGYRWDTPGSSSALIGLIPREHGISPNGTFVVGNSGTTPMFYDYDSNATAPLPLPAGATAGVANAVNDAEQIVGEVTVAGVSRVVVWNGHAAAPTFLDAQLGTGSAWTLSRAIDISNGGFVLGIGKLGGVDHAYVLDAPIVVNVTGDEPDANAADKVCDSDAGTAGLQCTMRAAIQTANAAGASSRTKIGFDITAGLPARPVITVTSPLPSISVAVEIDGTTQQGTNAAITVPRVVLKGAFAGANTDANAGLRLLGGANVVRGLNIVDFAGPGIFVDGVGGDLIVGNWIGFSYDGSTSTDAGNGIGINVATDNVTIGGTSDDDRNIITGNGEPQAALAALATFNAGGTEEAKAAALRGVVRDLGAGVLLESSSSTSTITGNYIGVGPGGIPIGDPAKDGGIGNSVGVLVAPTTVGVVERVTIGGAAAASNVITGNAIGVAVMEAPGATVNDVRLLGNKIGVNATGGGSSGEFLGNVFGVFVTGGANAVQVGASGAGNTIQGNIAAVTALGPRPTSLTVSHNDIGAGIALSSWADQLKESGTKGLGKLNLFGVWLVNTEGAVVSDNTITGNFIGVSSSGNLVSANTYRDNLIGREISSEVASGRDMKVDQLGGVIGMLNLANGADTISGNKLTGNAIGNIAVNSTGATWTGNTVDYNVVGLLCGSCHQVQVGRSGSTANQFSRNIVGMLFAHRELNADELKRAKLEYRELVKEQRDAAVKSDDATSFRTLITAFSGDDGSTELTEQQLDDLNVSDKHVIEHNLIGTTTDTATPTGGRTHANEIGVWVLGDVTDTTFGKTGDAGGANVIAHNRQAGIWLGPGAQGHWPRRVKIRSNRIFDNGWSQLFPGVPGMGIDIIDYRFGLDEPAFGPTANDDLDADDGPNGFQNFPELAGAAPTKGGTRVVGVLASKPRTKYKVEFFASQRCNKFGFGEGERVLGEKFVTTGTDGTVIFDATVTGTSKVGEFVTTTATEETDAEQGLGTSEFSRCAPVAAVAPKVIVGKATADRITGTKGPDVIDGKAGNDEIDGGGGNDVLLGGAGKDVIFGGGGTNTILAGAGDDAILVDVKASFAKFKELFKSITAQVDAALRNAKDTRGVTKSAGTVGTDTVRGGAGNDLIVSRGGTDTLDGGAGNDRIQGGTGADAITGGAGNDKVTSGAGNDRVLGGAGNDLIVGDAGNDGIWGDAGNDVLTGGKGLDKLYGGVGVDVLRSLDKLRDLLDGGPGRDSARLDQRLDTATAIEKKTFK